MSAVKPQRSELRRQHRGRASTDFFAAIIVAAIVAVLAVLAAWPIYETDSLWVVAAVGAALSFATVWLGKKLRWGAMTLVALAAVFILVVLPLSVPSALSGDPAGMLRGLVNGIAAVALGWKQLLTLSLPVGSYQTVLVPFLVVVFGSVAATTAFVLRGGRWAPLAGFGIVAPVLFGTVFGSSAVSDPLYVAGFTISAPRELALWLCAFGAAVGWIAWASGRDRRAALRRGRKADAEAGAVVGAGHVTDNIGDVGIDGAGAQGQGRSSVLRRNAVLRGVIAGVTVAAALGGALVLAPIITDDNRTVPRDSIDPELVVRSRVSPLASYRAWKRDDTLQAPLFSVTGKDGNLPSRLSLAVLSGYDGVDFSVGDPRDVGRFTRFPSGGKIADPMKVTVQVQPGYSDVWVPISAPLAGPPSFSGSRASDLADSFYLNRDTGSAVSVPTSAGLRDGDGFTATMSGAADDKPGKAPISEAPLVDLDGMPELARWLKLQDLPSTGDGVTEAIERLRDRGYLSHSLTDGAGEGAWIRELSTEHPIHFVSSTGGHSLARIEQLFAQLSDQQGAAGEGATDAMLVAGIGDDEQFATAAALIARAMGFDSRVVVGVRLASSGVDDAGVPGIPACGEVCTGANVGAWVEVRGNDGVWAPLDVSPQIDIAPTMLQKGEQLPEFPTQPEERNASESDPPVGMSNQDSGENGNTETGNASALLPFLRIAGLLTLGVALLALLVLFIPLVKRARTKRRQAHAAPEVQALGAWDELLDTYADSGTQLPSRARREDIMHQLDVDGGDWIAWTVDQAVFSREGIDDETAAQLWSVVNARVAEQKQGLGFWKRIKQRYSFASLGGLVGGRGTGPIRRQGKRETLR